MSVDELKIGGRPRRKLRSSLSKAKRAEGKGEIPPAHTHTKKKNNKHTENTVKHSTT
jgi:hypothetical protein